MVKVNRYLRLTLLATLCLTMTPVSATEINKKNRIKEFTLGCGYTLCAAAFFFTTKQNAEHCHAMISNTETSTNLIKALALINTGTSFYLTCYFLGKSYEHFKAVLTN